jgi:hypothetical protein
MEQPMVELNELEVRVLAVLEEAGEENVPSLLNTVLLGSNNGKSLRVYLDALRSLVRKDFVRLSISRGADRRLADLSPEDSLDQIEDQTAKLKFDETELYWKDTSRVGPPYGPSYPYVVLTKSGKEKSREILTERGYQWWSPIV